MADKKKKKNGRKEVQKGQTTTDPTPGILLGGSALLGGAYATKKHALPIISRGAKATYDASANVLKSPKKALSSVKNKITGAYNKATYKGPKGLMLPNQTAADIIGIKPTKAGGTALPGNIPDNPVVPKGAYKKPHNKAMYTKLANIAGESNVVPGLTGTPELGTVTKRGKNINYGKLNKEGFYTTPKSKSLIKTAEKNIAMDMAKAFNKSVSLNDGPSPTLVDNYVKVPATRQLKNPDGSPVKKKVPGLPDQPVTEKIPGGRHPISGRQGVEVRGKREIKLKSAGEIRQQNINLAQSNTISKNTRMVEDSVTKQMNSALGYTENQQSSKPNKKVQGKLSKTINQQSKNMDPNYGRNTSKNKGPQTTAQSMKDTNPTRGYQGNLTKAQATKQATKVASTKGVQLLGAKLPLAALGTVGVKGIPVLGQASIGADIAGVKYSTVGKIAKSTAKASVGGGYGDLAKSIGQASTEVSGSWKSRGRAVKNYVTKTMPSNIAKSKARKAQIRKDIYGNKKK